MRRSEKCKDDADGQIFRRRSHSYSEERFGLIKKYLLFAAFRNRKRAWGWPLHIFYLIIFSSLLFIGCKDDDVICDKEITLQPCGSDGKDATIWTEMPDHNLGNDDDLSIMAWTYYGSGYDEGKKELFWNLI